MHSHQGPQEVQLVSWLREERILGPAFGAPVTALDQVGAPGAGDSYL